MSPQLKCTILDAWADTAVAEHVDDDVVSKELFGVDSLALLLLLLLLTVEEDPPTAKDEEELFCEPLLVVDLVPSEMFTMTLSLSFTMLFTCFLVGDGIVLLTLLLLGKLLLLLLLPFGSGLLAISISWSSLLLNLLTIEEEAAEGVEVFDDDDDGAFIAAADVGAVEEFDSIAADADFETVAAALISNAFNGLLLLAVGRRPNFLLYFEDVFCLLVCLLCRIMNQFTWQKLAGRNRKI